MWSILDQRLHALLPRLWIQGITPNEPDCVHLVLVGPRPRAGVDNTPPRVIRACEILWTCAWSKAVVGLQLYARMSNELANPTFIDTMVTRTFERLLGPAYFHSRRSCSYRIR